MVWIGALAAAVQKIWKRRIDTIIISYASSCSAQSSGQKYAEIHMRFRRASVRMAESSMACDVMYLWDIRQNTQHWNSQKRACYNSKQ